VVLADIHCHIELEDFDTDRQAVIERARLAGLSYVIASGTEPKYYKKLRDICNAFDIVWGTVGVHPHVSDLLDDVIEKEIEQALLDRKILAIGECGLDFFKNYRERPIQFAAFERQVCLAERLSVPVIVHSRASAKETLQVLRGKAVLGLIHCFSYDVTYARAFLDLGFYTSIPGTVTYEKAEVLRQVVRFLPLDRILVETDSPFLSPNPKRGWRNEPSFVRFTVQNIAELKGIKEEELAQRTTENALRLFPKLRGAQ